MSGRRDSSNAAVPVPVCVKLKMRQRVVSAVSCKIEPASLIFENSSMKAAVQRPPTPASSVVAWPVIVEPLAWFSRNIDLRNSGGFIQSGRCSTRKSTFQRRQFGSPILSTDSLLREMSRKATCGLNRTSQSMTMRQSQEAPMSRLFLR